MERTSKGVVVTAVVVAAFTVVAFASRGFDPKAASEIIPVIVGFAVFVAISVGIGMFLIYFVRNYESKPS